MCRRATVDIADVIIEECKLNSTGAPIVVDRGSNVTFRSAKFFRNANETGPSVIKVLDAYSIVIEDCEFRSKWTPRDSRHNECEQSCRFRLEIFKELRYESRKRRRRLPHSGPFYVNRTLMHACVVDAE